MTIAAVETSTARYAKCIETSKRIRWEIERDVIRGRSFELTKKFLPDGLSQVDQLDFLGASERLLLSQIQGRTYAAIFGMVERFIGAKMLELTRHHWIGDQVALQALVGFTDEELKHQALFRQLEQLMAAVMPAGYSFALDPDEVAKVVLSKSTWAVLGLTCHIELFTQQHYKQSIAANSELSELYKDVFLFHWKEESQHAILDELEWEAEDKRLGHEERDRAVDDLIALVGAVDGLLQTQATADVAYFQRVVGRTLSAADLARVAAATHAAYRYQYIVSGVTSPRFGELLFSKLNEAQKKRVADALAPLLAAVTPPKAAPANPNKALWEKGDFTRIAESMRESGEALVQRIGVGKGLRVLDLGCGDGTTALPAARRGADVLGVDIARNLVEAGNERARGENLSNCRFQEGDATNLEQLKDGSFDLVVSIFGAMFAPRPFDVAKEVVRVTRPGGRIVMGNWIPDDPTLVAQVLRVCSAYTPPPPAGFTSPMTWGIEANVIERFAAAGIPAERIVCARDTYTFVLDESPSAFVDLFATYYGPTMNAFDAARKAGCEAELTRELVELFTRQNQSPNQDACSIPATFLRVTVTR